MLNISFRSVRIKINATRDGSAQFSISRTDLPVLFEYGVPDYARTLVTAGAAWRGTRSSRPAAVPDAKAHHPPLHDQRTRDRFTRTVTASLDGIYNFPDLPLGIYRFALCLTLGSRRGADRYRLSRGHSVVINLMMEVGPVSDQLTLRNRDPVKPLQAP